MKRIFITSVIGMLTCILLISSVLCVAAAPAAKVNGAEASVGSTVEYTLNIEAAKQKICGIQMIVKFDVDKLELKSVETPNMPSAAINANTAGDGMIYMNNSVITDEGLDFSQSKDFFKVQFEVKAEGETNIEYYIQYLYDFDMVPVYDYTLTYSLTVDGETEISTQAPLVADLDEILSDIDNNFDVGEFDNNAEGTGSGIKPTVATKAPATSNSDNNDGNNNTILYVVGGVVVAALIAVIVIAILKKNKK